MSEGLDFSSTLLAEERSRHEADRHFYRSVFEENQELKAALRKDGFKFMVSVLPGERSYEVRVVGRRRTDNQEEHRIVMLMALDEEDAILLVRAFCRATHMLIRISGIRCHETNLWECSPADAKPGAGV